MAEQNSIEEIFLKFLNEFQFDEEALDYSLVKKHAQILQTLSDIATQALGYLILVKEKLYFTLQTMAVYSAIGKRIMKKKAKHSLRKRFTPLMPIN